MRKKTAWLIAGLMIMACVFELTVSAKWPRKSDSQPPSAPQNLSASLVNQTSATLEWSASTDDKSITYYQIYKNSAYIASTAGTSLTVSGLTAATSCSFYVKAKDAGGNLSLPSNAITVTALPGDPTGTSLDGSSPDGSPGASSDGSPDTSPDASSPSDFSPDISSKNTIPPEASPPPATSPIVRTQTKILSAYYTGWSAYSGYTPLSVPASDITNIHYAFAKIGDDLKITMGDSYIDPINFTQLNRLKKSNPQLKTLISIGGWDDSDKFSDAALTDSSRSIFADSVVAFITEYGFNGADIDWEYPVSGGLSSNTERSADKTNFTLLLRKLREKLDAQGRLDGQRYLLTIAGGADRSYVSNTQLKAIADCVDYATVMTYDLHAPWGGYTDLNAPLYAPGEASPQYQWSVDQAVKAWITSGFPASKLLLGIPFYGYKYSGVAGGETGLYQSFEGGSSISYDKLISNDIGSGGYTKYFHPDALVPWLFNGSTFISYDNEVSMAHKAKYVAENGLAGATIWELSQNRGGQLLNALIKNLK